MSLVHVWYTARVFPPRNVFVKLNKKCSAGSTKLLLQHSNSFGKSHNLVLGMLA